MSSLGTSSLAHPAFFLVSDSPEGAFFWRPHKPPGSMFALYATAAVSGSACAPAGGHTTYQGPRGSPFVWRLPGPFLSCLPCPVLYFAG